MTSLPMFRPETLSAIEAVQRATEIAEAALGHSEVSFKDGRDVVTPGDMAVEDAIRELLGASFSYPVVGEERGGSAPADGSPYWLVDPICGTRNFASGLPLYCTNLALVEGGRLTVSAVNDPLTHELAVAELNGGAWALKDGAWRRLQTSDASRNLVIEEGKTGGRRRVHASRFVADIIRADVWDFRSFGSTVAYPELAAGRIAAYISFWATVVHAAAGTLLAQEAGAIVTNIDGTPWSVESDGFIAAATPALHRDLLALARATAG